MTTVPKYWSRFLFGNGSQLTCYIELKSEQRNIKFRFALYNSPLRSYKISLDNLLRERRSNDQCLDALILVIYRVQLWHEIFAGSNFRDFSSDPQKQFPQI